jgi:hypothetical protein
VGRDLIAYYVRRVYHHLNLHGASRAWSMRSTGTGRSSLEAASLQAPGPDRLLISPITAV